MFVVEIKRTMNTKSNFVLLLGTLFLVFLYLPVFAQPVATNQCISLNKPIYCSKPAEQYTNLDALVDGSDESYYDVTGPVEIAIQVDAQNTTSDRLILHWRAKSWKDRNVNNNSFKHIQLFTSHNSTNGIDGNWTLVKDFHNKRKDNVIFFQNTKPKWVKVKELNYHHLSLGRLDVFQTAPAGQKNDFWLFFGDSETKGNMTAGNTNYEAETYFSDKIREQNPAYYPIVINGGKGGETAREAVDSLPPILDELQEVSFVAFSYGLNDIFGSHPILVPYDAPENDAEMAIFENALKGIINVCTSRGVLPIPGRIPWVHFPNSYCYYNDPSAVNGVKPINRNVVDPIIKTMTPYAFDMQANRPLADFETWYRDHRWEDKVFRYDKVHHDRYGINQFNLIWVNTAQIVVYDNQGGTDPDPDPDPEPGCPDFIEGFVKLGEFNGHGYYQSNNVMSWQEGQALASANGGYLVNIGSEAENNFIESVINETVYIGLSDHENEGNTSWVGGSDGSYENYTTTCPWCKVNNANNDYVVMLSWDGSWAFQSDKVNKKVIMEVDCNTGTGGGVLSMDCTPNVTVTLQPNTTSMVVNWATPIATSTCTGSVTVTQVAGGVSGSSFGIGNHTITYQAMDNCNQSQTCSFVIQVNANTNGGGCGDITGFSKLGSWNGKTFYVSTDAQTWEVAKASCTANGGQLAKITSVDEQNYLMNLIDEIVYFGLNDVIQEGNMRWADGSAVGYTNITDCDWCGLNDSDNDYGVLLPWNGEWGFNKSVVNRKYIMQKNCSSGGGETSNNCPQTLEGYSNLGSFNNHNYYLSTAKSNWNTANIDANASGYLAAINTQAENDFLQLKIGNTMVFIGYNDKDSEGHGTWSNGEPVTLDLSFGNTNSHDYAVMNFWAGTWKLENELVAKRHVLEMECAAAMPPSYRIINNTAQQVRLYPNPSTNVITVQFFSENEEDMKFSIYNAQGQEQILSKMVTSVGENKMEFNVVHLKSGIYFLKMSSENTHEVFRFVKKE